MEESKGAPVKRKVGSVGVGCVHCSPVVENSGAAIGGSHLVNMEVEG